MKILFLHYAFNEDGVTRVVLNNIKGMQEISPSIECVLAGSHFANSIPKGIEKRVIDLEKSGACDRIDEISKDFDVVVIENPTVGIYPSATMSFKEYSERNKNKKVIYRVHDLIDDRPYLFKGFINKFGSINNIYPRTENVTFLALNSYDCSRLVGKELGNVSVLPNPVVSSDFTMEQDIWRPRHLRAALENEGIADPGRGILTYPVRVFGRKNIEEALLITKMMNDAASSDNPRSYKLIVTLPHDMKYQKALERIADLYDIPFSIGKASRHLGFDSGKGYVIRDLFSISDFVISTSVREGFGYAFIEPWLAGKAVIGRDIKYVTEDFKSNGLYLDHLYNNNIINASEDGEERMNYLEQFFKNSSKREDLINRLKLDERISRASASIEENRKAVEENYDYIPVAKRLIEFFQ